MSFPFYWALPLFSAAIFGGASGEFLPPNATADTRRRESAAPHYGIDA